MLYIVLFSIKNIYYYFQLIFFFSAYNYSYCYSNISRLCTSSLSTVSVEFFRKFTIHKQIKVINIHLFSLDQSITYGIL